MKNNNSPFRPEAVLFADEAASLSLFVNRLHTALTHRVGLIVLLTFALLPLPASAQGCTQCRDNAAATSPQTQAAYRHAIILMTGTAAALFLTTIVIFKRQR